MRIILLCFCFLFAIGLDAQSLKEKQMQKDVYFLADDELEGRQVGTKGEQLAAEFIISKMQALELEPRGDDSSFIQEFTIKPKANPHAVSEDSNSSAIVVKNLVGFLDYGAENTIVIGAHYDHLGHGAEGSLYAGDEKEIHNGADDNASGVAVLLQLASDIQNLELKASYNYLFIAFSGEERGLWGSNYFCKNPTLELSNVKFMINLDMVGRFDREKGLAISGVGTTSSWLKLLEDSNKDQLKLVLTESGVGPSDHTSFYLQDIPVLHFFTGQHADYHKPSDDADKVNFKGMVLVNDMILQLIENSMEINDFAFQKTKDESESTPRFTVTLGVMPDYMFQGEGMRIDGVTAGKPASNAGIEKGDIVIKMGEIEVVDMMTYMEALSKFKKGDKTHVTVKRGKKKITEEIQF